MSKSTRLPVPASRGIGGHAEAASSSADGDDAADGGAEDSEAAAAVFKAIRMQGWSGISMPRELHVGVFAFVNPVWCLKPPLPSPLSGVVLQHHTELVIDYSNTRHRRFWSSMAPQTAYELGQQMINLKCLVHRFPQTPDGAEGTEDGHFVRAFGWCRGVVIALVEGHAAGRQAARDKEGPVTGMPEGSLKSLSFEPVVISDLALSEAEQLNTINSAPLAAAPSHPINLAALTEAIGVHTAHSVIDGRGWTTPAVECVSTHVSDEIAHIRPFVATTRSLVDLREGLPAPSQVAELIGSIPVGQRGSQGPLAKLQTISYIKLFDIESADLIDGLRDLQACLVDRGCSKSLDLLGVEVHPNDCHSLILNDYAAFKALATFIDAICSPSGEVGIFIQPPADGEEVQDIPLPHLLAYTRFDFSKLPPCGSPLLCTLLQTYGARRGISDSSLVCPRLETHGPSPSQCRYVWTVTQDQLALPRNGPIAHSMQSGLVFPACEAPPEGYSISIECADGWTPPPDAIPPEPPELDAFSPIGLLPVTGLTVESRIGLGVAKMLLSKGAHLGNLQLMDMAPADVLDLLKGIRASQMPNRIQFASLTPGDGRQLPVLPFDGRLRGAKTLIAEGDIAIRLAALMRAQMTSLSDLAMSGSEAEARQALTSRGHGEIDRLSLGFVSEGGGDLIKAEDEREGITLGDHKDDLPSIKNLVMHLDVPSAAVVDPGTFILSALEVESISELTVVLPHRSHLGDLMEAVERRFAPQQIAIHAMDTDARYVMTAGAHQISSFMDLPEGQIELFMTAEHIAAFRKVAFAYSSTGQLLASLMQTEEQQQRLEMSMNLEATVKQLSHYLPSLPPDAAAEALATDFAGRMYAASLMSVIDPPCAPRRLKAPLMAVMQQRDLLMEPMLRLHGDGPCLTSPSVIASAAQLMAILQKTGIHIAGIELLYKATEHGHGYTDMLGRVGDARGLLFLVRSDGDMHGCFIDESIQPPSHVALNAYEAAGLVFKASGASPPTFQSPSVMPYCITVSQANNEQQGQLAKVSVGGGFEWLGMWAPPPLGWAQGADGRCCVRAGWEATMLQPLHPNVPPVPVYNLDVFFADEIEVFTVGGATGVSGVSEAGSCS
ncbi:unnamed protein product [Vitrella brassicaformis CCMP3155]|uniref:TLDc domain-containing protein n=1 Tax=Vitrella brassicaformis (strain CCMP3155) TaxID=1169540 RepID=A0A0G4EPV4_VITBC|nr:unnamed protein product [Vitrella brassicaformis CCMP3155]|eukprot:CEL99608.1 unnamed protein product [Vitrella brassicaformis CCMP3155]